MLAAACAAGAVGCTAGDRGGSAETMLITDAVVVDGTGAPARRAAIRIDGDRIVAVGNLSPARGETVIDAGGLVLAPGFVDTHSHGDRGIFDMPDALAAVSQGITTLVVGQDGGSPHPLSDFFGRLEAEPAAVNVASYSGHGTVRRSVMGDDFRRPATPAEVSGMAELLQKDLDAGALGLATGLEYDPGIYSETSEVIALARVAAAAGGRYISHIRSEDRYFWDAVDELVTIGREAGLPVQMSHGKLAMRSLWGQTDRLLERLDAARAEGIDVTMDVYPYVYWQSTLTVLFPERDFEDRAAAKFALSEVTSPEGMLIGRFDPDPSYVGMTLAEISARRGTDPATTLMALIRESLEARRAGDRGGEGVIATSMNEADVERLIAWPFANIASDGELAGRHPRGYGTFPRVLGRYVRERGIVPLEDAVRKMTSLAAANVGLVDRGAIAPGMAADLVLFDPATIIDRATPEEPRAPSEGVRTVWVNGQVVYDAGQATGLRPGRVLRRPTPPSP